MFGLSKPIHDLQRNATLVGISALFGAIGLFWISAGVVEAARLYLVEAPPMAIYFAIGMAFLLPGVVTAVSMGGKKKKDHDHHKRGVALDMEAQEAHHRHPAQDLANMITRNLKSLGPEAPLITIVVGIAAGMIVSRWPASYDIIKSLMQQRRAAAGVADRG